MKQSHQNGINHQLAKAVIQNINSNHSAAPPKPEVNSNNLQRAKSIHGLITTVYNIIDCLAAA